MYFNSRYSNILSVEYIIVVSSISEAYLQIA
jgi:hypothetical protein